MRILATIAQWDDENRFVEIVNKYLAYVMDERLITARKCLRVLEEGEKAKQQYIPKEMKYHTSLYYK